MGKEVATHHFSDWSGGNWLLWFAVLTLSVVLITGSVGVWFAAFVGEGEDGPYFIRLLGAAVFTGAGAFGLFAVSLWSINRHLSDFRWVGLIGFLTALLAVGGSYLARQVVVGDEGYYGARTGEEGRGLDNPWPLRIVAGLTATLVLGAILGDGLNRAAAWIPTTVGVLVAAIFCVFGVAAIKAFENR